MRVFLLAAGRGRRFHPVTESIPKPLFPFLNVPLIRAHLQWLYAQGFREAGVNLHHLGGQIERDLRDRPSNLPQLRFFPELAILGTAGALRNARDWLSEEDFLLVNTDTAIAPDVAGLIARHRESGRAATLLLAPNPDPVRYTPLQTEGDRVVGFGGEGRGALLYTGVSVLAPRLLPLIPPGETSLVADLWRPLLEQGRDRIGWVRHESPFSDLGVPSDFLRASLEALARGGPFPEDAGDFDSSTRVLSRQSPRGFRARSSVLGAARIGPGSTISESAVWDRVEILEDVQVRRCVVAGGILPRGSRYENCLVWPGEDGSGVAHPLEPVLH
jgi:mannose-1-phosphate guanylyltransferase